MTAIFYVQDLRTYDELEPTLPFLNHLESIVKDSARAKGLGFKRLYYQDRQEEPLPSPRRLALRLKSEFYSARQALAWNGSIIIVTNGFSFGVTVEALAQLKSPPRSIGLIALNPQSDVLNELEQKIQTDEDFSKYVPRNTHFPLLYQSRDRAAYFKSARNSRFDFINVCSVAAQKLSFCELILPPHEENRRISASILDFYNAAKGIVLNTELKKGCTYKDESAVLRSSIYSATRQLK